MTNQPTYETTPDGLRIYWIADFRVAVLQTAIDKLNKRAVRNELPQIALTVLGERVVPIFVNGIDTGRLRKLISLTVSAPTVKLDGWQLLARVQWLDEDPVALCAPGVKHPDRLTDLVRPHWCDHCGVQRNRKDTFLVWREEDKSFKQVGSNCLSDFLGGRNAQQLADWLQVITEACADAEDLEDIDHEGGEGGWGYHEYIRLSHFLPIVAAQIRGHGWLSKTRARDNGGISTAGRAWSQMYPPPGLAPQFIKENDVPVTDADVALANAAIEWAAGLYGQEGLDDYQHNIATIAHAGILTNRMDGYAASIITAYQRSQDPDWQPGQPRPAQKPSEWVGTIGQKVTVRVRVLGISSIGGRYGVTYAIRLRTADNERLVWFASNPPDALEKDAEVTLCGTVKDQTMYRERKETTLTRCKLIEVHSQEVTREDR